MSGPDVDTFIHAHPGGWGSATTTLTDGIEYTYCPGEGCVRKVKVWSLPDGQLGINFCCVDCWNYTYRLMLQDFGAAGDATEDELFHGHSYQCVKRAQQRENKPVSELVSYVIMGPAHHQAFREARDES